ncbi:Disease resistance protein L6 [Linum grandiflorum]
MNYVTGTVAGIAIIFLYKLFSERRRISNDSNNSTSRQSDSTTISSEVVSGDSALVSLPTGEYEVFLSFRGPDTRHHITDILYRFLVHLKIRTFRDDDELRKGEEIGPNLIQAIGQSKIYVPIISENYAHSKWCLNELVEIVQHHKQDQRYIILPIFYMVDPRHIRNQTGPYQSAFQQHKKNNFDEARIQSWKDALKEVGSLKGWHVKTKEEEAAVSDLVSGVVWSHLTKTNNTLATDELVGIDEHIEQVVNRLDLGSQGVKVVGIHGIGGIGKTTLAAAAYNKITGCFDRCSFLENIRETQHQSDGVLVLQRKIISNILRMDSVEKIVDINEGLKIISERVSQFKILVVLDDVDDKFQFKEVLGNINKFVSGSRFIITSRNIKILRSLSKDPHNLYEVQVMDKDRSLKLFCKHAFKQDFPLLGFEALSEDIVSTTGGLPLTLKVVGSLLFLEEKDIWKDKLEHLRKFPEEEVMERLMISYNGLGYEAQQIFLDIACFYIGTEKEIPSYMWSDCNFHPISSINLLIQRSLLKIGKENEFQMHDQVRDMGREIVRKESMEHPEMRSRIWSEEEGNEVLVNNKGTNQVRAIRAYSKGRALNFRSGCFANMTELRYFGGKDTELIGDFSHVLPSLKWMHFKIADISKYSYPALSSASFNMKNMIIFDVSGFAFESITTKEANKLKVLKLGPCDMMRKLPEFPESKSLEILSISWFENRKEDFEIGKLCNLKVLQLGSCKLGKIQGGTIGTTMKGLRELDLRDINCDYDSFRRVIADIEGSTSLQILNVESRHLVDVLKEIKLPTSLKRLYTSSGFANLEELLDLEELSIEKSSEKTTELVIPSSERDDDDDQSAITMPWFTSSQLRSMVLHQMRRIVMVESKSTMLPSSLTKLELHNVHSERIPDLKNLSNLTELEIRRCPNLQEVKGLGGLKSLERLTIYVAEKLTRINGLGNLMSCTTFKCRMKELWIDECPLLRDGLSFERETDADADAVEVESLLKLDIQCIPSLRLSKFPKLKELAIRGEGSTTREQQHQLLEEIGNLEELEKLEVYCFSEVDRLPLLSKLGKLKKLWLEDLPALREIAGLGDLKSLKELLVRDCLSLERLPISELPFATMDSIYLDLKGCTNFIDVDSDLSALTAEGADLGKLGVTIYWPQEDRRSFRRPLPEPEESNEFY